MEAAVTASRDRMWALPRAILVLALFMTVWGAKLEVIDRFGTDLPFWDQWAKEGELVYAPWIERGELWRNLVIPHNEHRIAPTLLLNFGLVIVSGQWDSRVQCIASAALHAAILIGIFLWGLRRMAYRWVFGLGALLALIGAAPIAWENVIGGFQSQFYFLTGFSLLAIGGLLANPAFSPGWWGGVATGGLALISMGSGALWTAPVITIAFVRLLKGRSECRRDAVAMLWVAILAAGIGAWWHTPMPAHEPLRARSIAMFFLYAAHCLSWPLVKQAWLGPIMWLPWLLLFSLRIVGMFQPKHHATTRPDAAPAATDFVLAAGFWVLLQVAAVAYSRSGTGEAPSSRYGDVFAIGVVMSFCALPRIGPQLPYPRIVTIAWMTMAAVCLSIAAREAWRTSLQNRKADYIAFERNVQQFMLTDNLEMFAKQALPFPNPGWLARILRHAGVRAILPASVRPPLRVAGLDANPNDGVTPLPNRATRALQQPDEWRSVPLPPGTGWWKIETSGHLGEEGASLLLVAVKDAHILDSIAPSKPAGNAWRAAYVRAPCEGAVFVARTDSAARWFAFSEPVEMSSLSHAAWRVGKSGTLIFYAGLVLGFSVIARQLHLMGRRPKPIAA